MEPRNIAKIIIDRAVDYCVNNYQRPLDCISSHTPNRLSLLAYLHLTDKDAEIKEVIQKSDEKLWKSIQEEYEKLWKIKMAIEVGISLGNILYVILEKIMENDNLSNADKVKYLDKYYLILDKMYYKTKYALQDSEPLSKERLLDWYMDIADAVSITNSNYIKEVQHVIEFYKTFDNNDKLLALKILFNKTGNAIEDLDKKYGALTMGNLNDKDEVTNK